ncbi:MAG: winged helix-turn-helix transcriptional regulator [Methanocellales archaeon]|nr:winged helix-turn-helix transcriptional regulator [Methanocellales archaeon]
MKKKEFVYRHILYMVLEQGEQVATQQELSKILGISLSTVNYALKPLVRMGTVKINPMNFRVIDAKKILLYWASIRNVPKDIIYSTKVDGVIEIEKSMPDDIVYGAYSAYKFNFKDVPADYSEVYVYSLKKLEDRFPKKPGPANLFVLEKDPLIEKYGRTTTMAQTYVDLWNINTWYAGEFIKALEGRVDAVLE